MQGAVDALSPGNRLIVLQDHALDETVVSTVDGIQIVFEGGSLSLGPNPAGELATRGWLLRLTGCRDVTVQRPKVVYGPHSFDDAERAALYLADTVDCAVTDGRLTDLNGMPAMRVRGTGASGNELLRNRVHGGQIIYSHAGAKRTVCRDNWSVDSPDNGFGGTGNHGTEYNEGCQVVGNRAIRCGRIGIEDWGKASDTVIRDNEIVDPAKYGISAVGLRPRIEGNTVEGASTYGIELASDGGQVQGNTVVGAAEATAIIVNGLGGSPRGANVQGNRVEAANVGAQIWHAGNTSIRHNHLHGCATPTNQTEPGAGCVVADNTVTS